MSSGGSGSGSHASSPQGLSGVTVQLKDSDGDVLATTVTDRSGHYSFNQLNGVSGTGNYTVTLVVPDGYSQTSKNPSTIMISRGGMSVGGVDFVLAGVVPALAALGRGRGATMKRSLGFLTAQCDSPQTLRSPG